MRQQAFVRSCNRKPNNDQMLLFFSGQCGNRHRTLIRRQNRWLSRHSQALLITALALVGPLAGQAEELENRLRSGPAEDTGTLRVSGTEESSEPFQLRPLPSRLVDAQGDPLSRVVPKGDLPGADLDKPSDDGWKPRRESQTPEKLQPKKHDAGAEASRDAGAPARQASRSKQPAAAGQVDRLAGEKATSLFRGLGALSHDWSLAARQQLAGALRRWSEAFEATNDSVTQRRVRVGDLNDDIDDPLDEAGTDPVTDAEQNEPNAAQIAMTPAEEGESQGDADAADSDAAAPRGDLADASTDGERVGGRQVRIRKLTLDDEMRAERQAAEPPRGAAAERTREASTRRPGSSQPDSIGDSPADADGPDDAASDAGEQPGQAIASESGKPIQGDRITSAGELILAGGQSAAELPISPQTARLKPLIEKGLHYYWQRPEDAAVRTHWGMMHQIMVFDRDTQIIQRRQRYNAVAWMAGNNACRNQLLFTRDRRGIAARTGVGLQGHQAQLLAIFGQINVPLDYSIYANRQPYKVQDLLQREMLDCKSGAELTFTLIALAHYTDSDTSWVSSDGQRWDVERVIREELAQPIVGTACGGTHRLMGFGHALRRRRAEGKPISGQWDRADRYLRDFTEYTWSLQNRDGSMSTAWFERSEDNGDLDRKIQTTGHMLELLMVITPDDQMQAPRMLRTVGFLAGAMYNDRGRQWQVGPKGHALRSLAMYYQRVFRHSAPWKLGPEERTAGGGGYRRRGSR